MEKILEEINALSKRLVNYPKSPISYSEDDLQLSLSCCELMASILEDDLRVLEKANRIDRTD
jgi:hypothetical protein